MTIHAERISAMYERAKVIEKNRLDVSFSGDTIVRTWPDFVQIPTATDSQEKRREPRVRGLLTHELVQDNKIVRILQQAHVTLDCVLEKQGRRLSDHRE